MQIWIEFDGFNINFESFCTRYEPEQSLFLIIIECIWYNTVILEYKKHR